MNPKNYLGELINSLLVTETEAVVGKRKRKGVLNFITRVLLRLMAFQFNMRPSLRRYMQGKDGWINFSVGIKTENESVEQAIVFHEGRVRVLQKIPGDVDVTMHLVNNDVLREMATSTPNEMLNLILKNKMVLDGNLAVLQLFNFFLSLMLGKTHKKKLEKMNRADIVSRKKEYQVDKAGLAEELRKRKQYRMPGEKGGDKGVAFLDDPYLPQFGIESFPRLKAFLDIHFNTLPEICVERPQLMTDWYRKNGFEEDPEGQPWNPELRQAYALNYLLENRKPIIRNNDLLAGSTTAKEVGVTIFPDATATQIWGELHSMEDRVLNPCSCSKETARILHEEIFPYWMHRNIREYTRHHHDYPLCQKIDERFVAYFVWKSVGISHTIPNFKRLMEKGTLGIIKDIEHELESGGHDKLGQDSLQAMKIIIGGVNTYALNLAGEASRLAGVETDPQRKQELERLHKICVKVPAHPAETLDEALNAIWIIWTAIHLENANTGTSLGRLDQWLQPYFASDMSKLNTTAEKDAYVKHAVDLVGCLYMRLTDHVPLIPDIGNYLFGGASSTQAITVGGITPEGEDAVNDMTYVFLKVTELLAIRDANVNARYHSEKNSEAYLKRLCEINVITSATPIMQNDKAMINALSQHGYPLEDINDWAATGCVEPTLQGQHYSHTACILLNMVASMEMALNNGTHPVMHWDVGPKTGSIEADDFKTFEAFFEAWAVQQRFMINQALELNDLFGEAHQQYRPTPLFSALIDGAIENGRDVIQGGAKYNSSGTSNIGLVDVTDSLLVIKQLVFDEKKVSFKKLKAAINENFANDPGLLATVRNKVRLFGSGDDEAVSMANRVAKTVHDCYLKHTSYRGGRIASGFWSMSQHVAYGSLSGPLPSGRLAGKAFTPGLTPNPAASKNFLDNITAVAGLDPKNMDNNLAFNVKLVPSAQDSREQTVDHMLSYVKSYFNLGGMQMQFNVVTSETLRDAMANPENYKSLMVRISGYNAYFVTLNKAIQIELIERAEYGL